MDVHLLVYDLSHGMARQMSMGMLGFQLDAIYHTSILIEGLEYVYQQSIRVVQPGAFSGFGSPIEKILLGETQLPHEVIIDYLNSVKGRFTPEAYNLFTHNCNNFTDEFAGFLVGGGIPSHISSMPQAVLNTPLGAMLQSQMSGMFPAGDPLPQSTSTAGQPALPQPGNPPSFIGTVKTATTPTELDKLLTSAQKTFAIIFFTSATCPPCKQLYPLYDSLARDVAHKGILIKVDITRAREIAMTHSISATPTFTTFLAGTQQEKWSGADAPRLKGAVHLLVQMAHPTHPHESLTLPTFFSQSTEPTTYEKIPPLSKLLAKLGDSAKDPAIIAVHKFIEAQATSSTLSPSEIEKVMTPLTNFITTNITPLPLETTFPLVDLLRCTLANPRVADFVLAQESSTIEAILDLVTNTGDKCPYALRLTTLHLSCNLSKSSTHFPTLLRQNPTRTLLLNLITTSLLDSTHSNIRVSAATLVLNLALENSKPRREGNHAPVLPEEDQVELAVSVLEAIAREEESEEALRGLLLALGFLVYLVPVEGEVVDLLTALEAGATVRGKAGMFPGMRLVGEVGELISKLL